MAPSRKPSGPSVVTHINAITSDTPPERASAMAAAEMIAPQINNQARRLSAAGDHRGAIELHQKALQMKVAAFGISSMQAGLSLNALGEEYLTIGDLNRAEEMLLLAREARDTLEAKGRGGSFDAAVTRENLGRVYEAKGEWQKARDVRVEGKDGLACSNYNCPGQTFRMSKMKRCGACRAPVYCSKTCQGVDWRERHKALCQARKETTDPK